MDLWMELYNSRTYDEMMQLYYRHAGGSRELYLLLGKISVLIPGWTAVAEKHRNDFREFVKHWIADELGERDWARALQWSKVDKENPFAWFLSGPKSRFMIDSWLISRYKTNPYQPFEQAYREVLALIAKERGGELRLRAMFCVECGSVFMPDRASQRWCGARCRSRFFQRRSRSGEISETGKAITRKDKKSST